MACPPSPPRWLPPPRKPSRPIPKGFPRGKAQEDTMDLSNDAKNSPASHRLNLASLAFPSNHPRLNLPMLFYYYYSNKSEERPGLWSIMRKCIGKDLMKAPVPIAFNEPLSGLQRWAEELEYATLLDKAAERTTSLVVHPCFHLFSPSPQQFFCFGFLGAPRLRCRLPVLPLL